MRDMMTGTMNSIRPLLTSSLPAGEYREKRVELFVKNFESKMDVGQLLTELLPVYDQYFATAEIEQLTQFYDPPLGKKYLAIAPHLLAAAQKNRQDLGRTIGSGRDDRSTGRASRPSESAGRGGDCTQELVDRAIS
jgi:hypothetical protein